MNIFSKKAAALHRKKGAALMFVITTIAFLVVMVQQIAFDSSVESKSGSAYFHGLKAYYAAKSGMELTVLKIFIYQEVLKFLNSTAQSSGSPLAGSVVRQAQSQLYRLWKPALVWPPLLSEDISDIAKSSIQENVQNSFFNNVSYTVHVENESSKLNLNDMASPHSPIRFWAQTTLTRLLMHLRDKEPWLSSRYSEQDLSDTAEEIQKHLNPSSLDPSYLKRRFINADELLMIEGMSSELLEFLTPYITVYSSGGLYLQFAKKLLIQSLSGGLNEEQAEDMTHQLDVLTNEEALFISSVKELEKFEEWSFINSDEYSSEDDKNLPLRSLVFNFDAPQNFRITAQGVSGFASKSISAVIRSPYSSIKKAHFNMDRYKEKLEYKPSDTPPSPEQRLNHRIQVFYPSTPFITEWKDVN